MQSLKSDTIHEVRKMKIQKLDGEMREVILAEGSGHLFICPYCQYVSRKNSKGSAKLFQDSKGLFFKCFSCGIWRAV